MQLLVKHKQIESEGEKAKEELEWCQHLKDYYEQKLDVVQIHIDCIPKIFT